ncbi:MAG: single-stranded DNA-binding protein [Clostridia bacterium]
MNKAILIGRLTADPEVTQTPNGITYARFTVAINRTFKGADGAQQADFIPVVVWRAQAENCGKYLQKGSQCAVTGTIQTRTYDKNGEKRYATEVVADNVEFLARPGTSSGSDSGTISKKNESIDSLQPIDDGDDQLPF